MSTDPFDDLIVRAAPRTRSADLSDVSAMIAQARTSAATRRARPTRLIVATGAVCALLVGGAGVAVAQSGWSWDPGYLDPSPTGSSAPEQVALFVYPYVAPSGASCELRVSGHLPASDTFGDALLRHAGSDGELKDRVDRDAASAFAETLASIERGNAERLSPTPQPQTSDAEGEDFAYFQALSKATFDAMAAVLSENGHEVSDVPDADYSEGWSTSGNCAGAGE